MFFNLNVLIPFILIGLFFDVYIFHHFRKDGDVFDSAINPGRLVKYVNCCLCHGFSIGFLLTICFADHTLLDLFIGGAIISISALTYRILVLKE